MKSVATRCFASGASSDIYMHVTFSITVISLLLMGYKNVMRYCRARATSPIAWSLKPAMTTFKYEYARSVTTQRGYMRTFRPFRL